MALDQNAKYPVGTLPATADYPEGSAVNSSAPGALNGYPLEKDQLNDRFGLEQALLRLSGQVASGTPDTALLSQYLKGIIELASGRAINYDDSGAADAYVLDVRANQQGPAGYFDGFTVRFTAANDNTGGPATANANGIGVANIKTLAGEDPVEGDITGDMELRNNGVDFIIIPQLTNSRQSFLRSGRKNKFINGDFDIWQRATSQTSSGYGSDDRWSNLNVGSTKVHSQQTFTLGQTDVPGNPEFYSRTVVTSVAGAGNFVQKVQRIEGVESFSGEKVALSFRAKVDSAKDIAVGFLQNFGTSGSPSADVTGIGVTTFSLTTAWQLFTVVVDIPSIAGKTLGSDDNDYLQFEAWFDAGSDFNARTNSLGQQSGTFDISHVQIEKSSVVTEFEKLLNGQVSDLCQRFYKGYSGTLKVLVRSTTTADRWLEFARAVDMRATPSETGTPSGGSISLVGSTDRLIIGLTGAPGGDVNISGYTADAEL